MFAKRVAVIGAHTTRRFPLTLVLLTVTVVSALRGDGDIEIIDPLQSRSIGFTDLAGGAGASYISPLVFSSSFTLRVNSSGPCQLWVRRQDAGPWLSGGKLQVRILRTGETIDPRPPVTLDTSDALLLESPEALDNQIYELRYQLENFSTQNAPGSYSAQVVFTFTDA
jgi:hypothetical protein